MADGMRW